MVSWIASCIEETINLLNYYRVQDEAQPIDWGTGADLLAVWAALDQCGVGKHQKEEEVLFVFGYHTARLLSSHWPILLFCVSVHHHHDHRYQQSGAPLQSIRPVGINQSCPVARRVTTSPASILQSARDEDSGTLSA